MNNANLVLKAYQGFPLYQNSFNDEPVIEPDRSRTVFPLLLYGKFAEDT